MFWNRSQRDRNCGPFIRGEDLPTPRVVLTYLNDDGVPAACHCVMSRRMCADRTTIRPYYLGDYHGRKAGPTIHTDLPVGQEVTVARLTKDLESLLLVRGTVVVSHDSNHRCRNTVAVEVADRSAVLKAVKGVQTHLVLACGDHTEALLALAAEAGIRVTWF